MQKARGDEQKVDPQVEHASKNKEGIVSPARQDPKPVSTKPITASHGGATKDAPD